jgi:hypothetical protein
VSSNGASVGNLCGKVVATFLGPGNSGAVGLGFLEVPPFYKARTFQLLLGGATDVSVEIFGTLDRNTAEGNASNWEPIPAPSTEASPAWSNPLTDAAGTRMFYCNAPLAAVYAVATSPMGGWTAAPVILLMLAAT